MPIVSGDITYQLSGGAANAVPLSSIGGAKSSVASGTTIFDDVSSAEATSGDTEYRCVYITNNHGTLTMLSPKVWIQANTPSTFTDVGIGLGAQAVNVAETAIANENTAPGSVTFNNTYVDYTSGLALGDIPPGQFRGIWIRRTVTAGATVLADGFTLRVQCDTNP